MRPLRRWKRLTATRGGSAWIGEDVGVVAGGGGHVLLLLDLRDGGDEVAEGGGAFVLHGVGGLLPCGRASSIGEVAVAAFEEEPRRRAPRSA